MNSTEGRNYQVAIAYAVNLNFTQIDQNGIFHNMIIYRHNYNNYLNTICLKH